MAGGKEEDKAPGKPICQCCADKVNESIAIKSAMTVLAR